MDKSYREHLLSSEYNHHVDERLWDTVQNNGNSFLQLGCGRKDQLG